MIEYFYFDKWNEFDDSVIEGVWFDEDGLSFVFFDPSHKILPNPLMWETLALGAKNIKLNNMIFSITHCSADLITGKIEVSAKRAGEN